MRFIHSLPLGERFIYNGDKQTEKWAVHKKFIFSLPLENCFTSNGDTQTEKLAVHNEVYIQPSIGETFYIQWR